MSGIHHHALLKQFSVIILIKPSVPKKIFLSLTTKVLHFTCCYLFLFQKIKLNSNPKLIEEKKMFHINFYSSPTCLKNPKMFLQFFPLWAPQTSFSGLPLHHKGRSDTGQNELPRHNKGKDLAELCLPPVTAWHHLSFLKAPKMPADSIKMPRKLLCAFTFVIF